MLAEERIGFVTRERERMARAAQDAAWSDFSSKVKADGTR